MTYDKNTICQHVFQKSTPRSKIKKKTFAFHILNQKISDGPISFVFSWQKLGEIICILLNTDISLGNTG